MIENSKQDIKIVSRDNVYAYDENGKRYIIRKGTRWEHINVGKEKIGVAGIINRSQEQFDYIFNYGFLKQ